MLTKPCLYCKTPFKVIPARMERAKFCSRACKSLYHFGKAPNATEQRVCKICKTLFTSELHTSRQHVTCSATCAAKARSMRPSKKAARTCQRCGASFLVYPSRKGSYCSRSCADAGIGSDRQGTARTSTVVTCDHCGKQRKLFRSRRKAYAGHFCDMRCYLASRQSGAERKVAAWLGAQGIAYEAQHQLGRRVVDFWASGTVIEVNGCYWHACVPCGYTTLNKTQRRRVRSDKALQTYCKNRNIPIVTIWEHDIDRNDYSALIAVARHS